MGSGTADTKEPETTSACYNVGVSMLKNSNLTKVIFILKKMSHIQEKIIIIRFIIDITLIKFD